MCQRCNILHSIPTCKKIFFLKKKEFSVQLSLNADFKLIETFTFSTKANLTDITKKRNF